MTGHRDYDLTDASVVRNGDPFDMPSQPQPGEDDERELIYRDLQEATADLERLRQAARAVVEAAATGSTALLHHAISTLKEAL
ncbi:MAG: hypothetical protein KIS96_03715 [Bauldia sp.]|nr:hypothetical protein [Bauldia sp.]